MSFAKDLRASVLQAAMQGKLTEQLETDTPVSELLADIKAEKNRLIAEKKIKKEKPLFAIPENDIPFDIPESWEWIKMGELVKISTGKRDANYGTEDGKYDFYTCSKIPIKSPTFSFEGECLILPGNGANVGEVYYYNGQFEAYQRTYVLEKYISEFNICFLEKVLLWNWKQFNANKQFGSAIPYIKLGNLQDFPVPLPPIEEQKRIVRRIEEIMIRIDELEAIEEELKRLKEVFPSDMKAAVLQAAMQGKLTEQLDTDSSVDDLLEDIKAERDKLVKEGKIKKTKTQQNSNFVELEDVPFDIPSNWKWVELKNIAMVMGGKRVPVGETLVDYDTGHKYIRVADMESNTINVDSVKFITDKVYSQIKNYFIRKNDIYITVAGTIGRVGIVPAELDMANLTENADKIIFSNINRMWLLYILSTPFLQNQISLATKKVGQPKLALNKVETLILPLPPIEEQQRIVDNLETILSLIEDI